MKYALLLMLILLFPVAYGAEVFGVLYSRNLDPVTNVIIEVNSVPLQRVISRDGSYSFNLDEGIYTITAKITIDDEEVIIAQEDITIGNRERRYIVDLFVDPGVIIPSERNGSESESNTITLLIIALSSITVIAISTILALLLIKKKKKKQESTEYTIQYTNDEPQVIHNEKIDPLEKKILEIIAKEDGTITQKEIRKQIDLSEAKISSVLSELTKTNRIEKIKKGRINVLKIK